MDVSVKSKGKYNIRRDAGLGGYFKGQKKSRTVFLPLSFSNFRRAHRVHTKSGITLVEILIAMTLGVIVFMGIGFALYYLFALDESTRNEEQIHHDLTAVMERIDNTTLNNLNTLYPTGSVASAEINNVFGGYGIEGEAITVAYPGGTGTNPREIVLTAGWTERGRPRVMSLRTIKRA